MDKSRFKLFAKFSEGLFKYALDAFVGSGGKNRGTNMTILLFLIVVFCLLIILAYAGVETVKLLLRKGFGKKGVSISKAVISSIVFFVLAGYSYTYYSAYPSYVADYGSQASFLYASVVFLLVGLVVFLRAVMVQIKNSQVIDPIYRGNSNIFGFLIKDGWSPSLVQDLAEPLFFLSIGVYLLSFNFIWGAPFIFCAISVWLHLVIEAMFGFFNERSGLSNEGYAYTQNRQFSKIIN